LRLCAQEPAAAWSSRPGAEGARRCHRSRMLWIAGALARAPREPPEPKLRPPPAGVLLRGTISPVPRGPAPPFLHTADRPRVLHYPVGRRDAGSFLLFYYRAAGAVTPWLEFPLHISEVSRRREPRRGRKRDAVRPSPIEFSSPYSCLYPSL
jgi:hypothetical protein